jgi:hypothetical protein
MIVRDEAQWIEPALTSALELGISHWVVVDTGSEDETREIVREKLRSVPGELIEAAWEGYGPARSLALARTHESDLTIMLDADMTISGELPDPGEADSWLVQIADAPWSYYLPLLTGRGPWYYKGSAHAFLHRDDRRWVQKRSELRVLDRRPGGWRPGKLEDDARLLEAELERNPLHARSSFYLAQTYEDLGRTGEALREYSRRALLGGYDQERFVALLRRARILCEREPTLALGACLEAWQARPTRAEPLYVAARQARRSGMDDVALLLARRAIEIEKPDDTLFVEEGVYSYGIAVELGIAEMRAGDRERGVRILADLLYLETLPQGYRDWIRELLPEEVLA